MDRYDKISKTWILPLPGDGLLPVFLRREPFRAYETVTVEVDQAAAQALLEERLLLKLQDLLGETGEEVSHSFAAQVREGQLVVELTAECKEELGRFIPAQ